MEALLLILGALLYLAAVGLTLAVPFGMLAVAVIGVQRLLRALVARAGARAEARRGLRPSDRDRATVLRRLSDQCAAGRLTYHELEDRAERTWSARTYAQLERLERDLPEGHGRARLERFRGWLYAAAIYNACWGAAVVLLASPVAWKCVGMLVLVFAPAYWWAAQDPDRHAHVVAIGLLGKILGPLGFIWAAGTGRLPAEFVFVILANDVLWWAAFGGFVHAAAQAHGGWRRFLAGT
jgi:small multidrug resistance pump